MKRIVAIVQARMGSTRLPGKVLKDIAGKPMLQHVIERLQRADRLAEVVLATSTHPQDRVLLDMAGELGVRGVAGSEDDVLSRYARAARETEADAVVRITSDCPLIDPELVDRSVGFFLVEKADYAANCIQQTFPRGMETEVFSAGKLFEIDREAQLPYEREHVTPRFYQHAELYAARYLSAEGEYHRPELRLCVDTTQDLALVRGIFDRLGPDNTFPLLDIIRLLDREPDLRALNAQVKQKELGE